MEYRKVFLKDGALSKDSIPVDLSDIVRPVKKEFAIRTSSNLKGLGYFLNAQYDYIVVRDNTEALVLLTVKK